VIAMNSAVTPIAPHAGAGQSGAVTRETGQKFALERTTPVFEAIEQSYRRISDIATIWRDCF